ncbi:MAG TPA: response regulator, partial [Acidimicrobiales bacterium]|nr:response regulator [Acidimicrobiales bacterium]
MATRAATADSGAVLAMDGATVLVVDDGEANVLLLQRLLALAGAGHVEGVSDPRLAVERFQAVSPDIVLLDMHMPWMDGLEVLDALNAVIPPGSLVPIVVLTADTT